MAGQRRYSPSQVDLERVLRDFGVAEGQVRRDFVISWMLASIAKSTQAVVFLGGTALSRTLLPTLRLSEDIDLMPLGPREAAARAIHEGLVRDLERGFGRVRYDIPLDGTRHPEASTYRIGDQTIRIQLVERHAYSWPWEVVALEQRYEGCPAASMPVLTPSGFVAGKTAAWVERNAPRDLYDLWALAEEGHFSADALEVFRKYGPTGRAPSLAIMPASPPPETQWTRALSHQGRIKVGPGEAFVRVRDAWLELTRAYG